MQPDVHSTVIWLIFVSQHEKVYIMHPLTLSHITISSAYVSYCIAGFVCQVLIFVKNASCHRLTNFNSAVSYSCIFISAHCTCHSSVLVIFSLHIRLCLNISKEWKFLLRRLTQKAKGSRWLCASWFMMSRMTLQHFSNLANFPKHPCRCGIFWSQSLHYNDSTLDSTLHAIACEDFTRSRNLVIGLLHRYNSCRYYCWAEKLILRRNWASQTKSTIRYANSVNYITMHSPKFIGKMCAGNHYNDYIVKF